MSTHKATPLTPLTSSLVNRDFPSPPSEKQYKTQLKKWSLDTKYIKASEYLFMIKTMRERAAQNPPKETQFVLRGRVVDPKDIARFEKRAQKRGSLKKGDPIECDGKRSQLALGYFWLVWLTAGAQNRSRTLCTARRPRRRPPTMRQHTPRRTNLINVRLPDSLLPPVRTFFLTLFLFHQTTPLAIIPTPTD